MNQEQNPLRISEFATDNNAIFLEHLQNYNLEVQQALTYLSLWNLESFDKVEIFFEKDLSISARYSSSQHLRSYFLAGIWNQDTNTYTFHS